MCGSGVEEKWLIARGKHSGMRLVYVIVQKGNRKRRGKCRGVSDNRNRYLRQNSRGTTGTCDKRDRIILALRVPEIEETGQLWHHRYL